MIAQSTRIQAYQLRAGGTHARMAILRMLAADSANNANPHTRLQAGDWRGARHYTLKDYEHAYGMLSQGFNDKTPVWYSSYGACFRDERNCDEILTRMDHTGWFGDTENGEKLHRGIVGRLTHGRFIAGYEVAENEERVYFPEVFTDGDDAARMADKHARVAAECELGANEREMVSGHITDIRAFRREREALKVD